MISMMMIKTENRAVNMTKREKKRKKKNIVKKKLVRIKMTRHKQ